MATFSTWSSLVTAIKDALASDKILYQSFTTPAGVTVRFRDLTEVIKLLRFAESMAAADDGATAGDITVADFSELDSA